MARHGGVPMGKREPGANPGRTGHCKRRAFVQNAIAPWGEKAHGGDRAVSQETCSDGTMSFLRRKAAHLNAVFSRFRRGTAGIGCAVFRNSGTVFSLERIRPPNHSPKRTDSVEMLAFRGGLRAPAAGHGGNSANKTGKNCRERLPLRARAWE